MSDETETGYAPGWKPSPGDRVVGTITDIDTTDLGNGPYAVLTVKRENGDEVGVHAFHTVLRRELAKRRPKIGDDIDITYVGKKTEGGQHGRGYDFYRVRGGDKAGYDWSRDLPDDDSPAAVPDVLQQSVAPQPSAAPAAGVDEIARVPAPPVEDDCPF